MKRALAPGAILLMAAITLGWFFARPLYGRYQEQRAVERAREYLKAGDFPNASLSARRALLANPDNVEACRVMAGLAGIAGSPDALGWQRRIVEREPSVENKLQLADVALRFQAAPFSLTEEILEEISPVATNLPGYHVVSAEKALKLKDIPGAKEHFEMAMRMDPTNAWHRLNLAVLNLHSTNAIWAKEGRAELERLGADPNLRELALRWLTAECLKRRDLEGAKLFSTELLSCAKASLGDRLQHLGLLRDLNSPEFGRELELAQLRARTNAVELYSVCAWMISRGMTADALSCVTNSPADIMSEHPAALALVDCYVAAGKWELLESYLLEEQWGDLECMRLAYLGRAAFELKQPQAAEVRWRSAIRAAADRPGQLKSLLRMASDWGQDKAREDLLWQMARHFPRERWTLLELERQYTTNGDTLELNKVYALMMSYEPTNVVARNNFAATSLLLNLNVVRARRIAEETYLQYPREPVVASTYAYALHLEGRTAEALETMGKLSPAELKQPSVALYYGVMLSAAGDLGKAKTYLEAALGGSFLPEETALLKPAAEHARGP